MRPAPSVESPAPAEARPDRPRGAVERRSRPRPGHSALWWLSRAMLVLVELAVLGGTVVLIAEGSGSVTAPPSPGARPEPIPTPALIPAPATFAFTSVRIESVRARPPSSVRLARTAAEAITAALSDFYLQAFAEPSTWSRGAPGSAWEVFEAPLRRRARADAASLTLGKAVPDLADLTVTRADLKITVLLDSGGRPRSAMAAVAIEATGAREGGGLVAIGDRATLLLQPQGGRWLVVGYPRARVTVDTVQPPPSPSPSATPTTSSGGAPATSSTVASP